MAKPLFYFSQGFQGYNMGPQHPLKPRRLFLTYDLLDSYGLFDSALEVAEPELADEAEVAQTHSLDYLEALSALDRGETLRHAARYGFGSGDNPIFPNLYGSSLLYTGASILAAQSVNDGAALAFNISGGLHHAHYARAAGFCVLNDCAVGIRRLRRKFDRVAYVDIDVHHGDGVQELFYGDPTVLTVSIHESGRTLFPGTGFVSENGEGTGVGYSVNVPLAAFTDNATWINAFREGALHILKAFDPQAIFLQMGTDAHYLDPLAHVSLTAQGWLEAVKEIRALNVPIVAVGGGGYNLTTVPRMWTLAISTLLGLEIPDAVPVSCASRAEIPFLRDPAPPQINPRDMDFARQFAEETVQELRQTFGK